MEDELTAYGKMKDPVNYRGTSRLSILPKIYTNLLAGRMNE
jgi:hypothetical protein